ncbi:hypothetical protein HMPREF2533_02544 [Bacteroides fragilis]|nr:hypothetical protein HMPREF2530_02544 [Bacteroides fragilis]KXU45016.1 hypothetical protein HMPREF2533_02544 [Bacteroides fragilis]
MVKITEMNRLLEEKKVIKSGKGFRRFRRHIPKRPFKRVFRRCRTSTDYCHFG